jgi:hypothetical protein
VHPQIISSPQKENLILPTSTRSIGSTQNENELENQSPSNSKLQNQNIENCKICMIV